MKRTLLTLHSRYKNLRAKIEDCETKRAFGENEGIWGRRNIWWKCETGKEGNRAAVAEWVEGPQVERVHVKLAA